MTDPEQRSCPSLRPARPSLTRRDVLGAGAALVAGLACRAAGPRERSARSGVEREEADLIDELLGDLTDQSARWAPIAPAERVPRLARLRSLLALRGSDAVLVEPGATLEYLTGVKQGRSERLFALLVPADGDPFWILPAFEESAARGKLERAGAPSEPGAIVTWNEHEYAFAPLAAELARRGIERLAIEPSTRAFVVEGIEGASGRRVQSGVQLVTDLRGRKDAHELELLRAASELTQRALDAVAERLEPGTSDARLGACMRRAQERLGLTDTWVLPLLGASAALPHGSAEGRLLERGGALLVDTGGALHGYQSDRTRSWIFDGQPDARYERAWNTVRDAQRAAFERMAPGVACAEVDAAARRVIEAAGFGSGYQSFTHRLGHGIGLEVHEGPYFDGGSQTLLAPGMTFSDEPGIYLPDELGVRLEDIVAITADGAENFGGWQRSPLSPGV